MTGGHVRLLPHNPDYSPIPGDEAILGKVVTVIRSPTHRSASGRATPDGGLTVLCGGRSLSPGRGRPGAGAGAEAVRPSRSLSERRAGRVRQLPRCRGSHIIAGDAFQSLRSRVEMVRTRCSSRSTAPAIFQAGSQPIA